MKTELVLEYVISNSDNLKFSEAQVLNNRYSIIWNKQGIHRIVPLAKIQNLIELDYVEASCATSPSTEHYISWNELDDYEIPSNIANLLLGDDYSDNCRYNSSK